MMNQIKNMSTAVKMKLTGIAAVATIGATKGVSAAALIANDTLEGLPSAGTQVGDFMGNLAPGLFKFLLLIGLAVAIVGVVVAIIGVVKSRGVLSVGRR